MMSRFSFKSGECLRVDGIAYRISQVIGNSVQLTLIDDGSLSIRSVDELLERYANGQAKFVDERELSIRQRDYVQGSVVARGLADFPEKIQRLALRKYKFLRAICPDGRLTVPRSALPEMLRSTWEKMEPAIRCERPPCVASFFLWRRAWLRSNFDVRALIDKWEGRGRKPESMPSRLAELIEEGIEKIYLTPQRESLREVHDWIQFEIEKENRRRAPEEALPRLAQRMLKRAVDRIDRYALLKARYGERYAREATRIYSKGPACTRPLERVEVDHTPLDILVIDSTTGLLLGRPWITVMIDAYSRMVVGFNISFRPPCTLSVLRCLKHAILPKSHVRERFNAVKGDWSVYGLIEELVCDNGLEFHAQDLEVACADLGIHVTYCPSRSPQMKGRIERFLKTINYGLLHLQPGTTFATYDKRHEYKSEAQAALTLNALHEIVYRWIIDVYSITFHRGILSTPQQKWDEGAALCAIQLPPSTDILNVYLGNAHKRKLSKSGVQAHSLHYASTALQDLWRRRGDIEVTVRTDPDNIGTVFVFDDEANHYIEAKCTLANYGEGVTAEQHKWILKKAATDYMASPFRFALLAAKSALRDDTAQLITQIKPGKTNGKRPKASNEQRELLVQHEETRQMPLPFDAESDEADLRGPQDDELDDRGDVFDVPLFPTRRAPISRDIPEQGPI